MIIAGMFTLFIQHRPLRLLQISIEDFSVFFNWYLPRYLNVEISVTLMLAVVADQSVFYESLVIDILLRVLGSHCCYPR